MKFIDIHGHYAWDIDDGIPSLSDAYKTLEIAKQNNIIAIVATPHVIPGYHTLKDIEKIRERIDELKDLAKQFQIEIFEGCELFLNHECIHDLHQHLFIPFENTQYLLVEFDVRKELSSENEVEDYLHEIEILGYTPIIAHIERYFKKDIDFNRVEQLIDDGYIIQVNATSFLGVHGQTNKNNAYSLIERGLVHIIASDTHRSNGHRTPCLQNVYNILSRDYDYQTIKTLMYDNPLHILNNENVEMIHIKQSFLKKLFKRR